MAYCVPLRLVAGGDTASIGSTFRHVTASVDLPAHHCLTFIKKIKLIGGSFPCVTGGNPSAMPLTYFPQAGAAYPQLC